MKTFKMWAMGIILLAGAARASNIATADIPQYIDAASSRVWIYAPYLRSEKIVTALKNAKVKRGLDVRIVSTQQTVLDKSSFVPSLALAGVPLYLLNVGKGNVGEGLLLTDLTYMVQGNRLTLLETPTHPYRTTLSEDPMSLIETKRWFDQAFQGKPVSKDALVHMLAPATPNPAPTHK
jgi:hypothetical protein